MHKCTQNLRARSMTTLSQKLKKNLETQRYLNATASSCVSRLKNEQQHSLDTLFEDVLHSLSKI